MLKIISKLSLLIFTLSSSLTALASPVIPISAPSQTVAFTPTVPNIDAQGFILIDANSGKILAEKNSEHKMAPASLTKLMSIYIISGALKSGAIHLDDKVRISTKAWKTDGSRMFVKVNDEVPVRDLLQGIVVASGNDATVAMAEFVAGSEDTFVNMMNNQAKLLGMKNSHFLDSTGLPNPNHYSTPYDLAILAQALTQHYPEDYKLFSEKWFTYNGIRQPNRNRLLWRYQFADGLKTGHTDDAGYCLVSSAIKDGMRLISVIMGAPNDQARTEDSIRLLNYGFRFYETHKLQPAGTVLSKGRVWKGTSSEVPLGVDGELYVTVPTNQFKNLQTKIEVNEPLKAPIIKGNKYGTVNFIVNNQVIASKPLIALEAVNKGGFLRNVTDSVGYNFHRIFSHTTEKANNG